MSLYLKLFSVLVLVTSLTSCATMQAIEEQKEELKLAMDKADNEECISYGFSEGTEAYGGCRLTLKSIRSQDKNTAALKTSRTRDSLNYRLHYCRGFYCW